MMKCLLCDLVVSSICRTETIPLCSYSECRFQHVIFNIMRFIMCSRMTKSSKICLLSPPAYLQMWHPLLVISWVVHVKRVECLKSTGAALTYVLLVRAESFLPSEFISVTDIDSGNCYTTFLHHLLICLFFLWGCVKTIQSSDKQMQPQKNKNDSFNKSEAKKEKTYG